jgi:hypothetical protein
MDKREKKRLVRAGDGLRRGLARRDASLSVSALLSMPVVARDEHLGTVSLLVVDTIRQLHRGKQWPLLARLGIQIAEEPRLLSLSKPAQADEARWSLVWGHALSGSFDRARSTWRAIDTANADLNPSLARAMSLWLEAEGDPAGEDFARFARAADDVVERKARSDQRLASVAPRFLPDDPTGSIAQAFVALPWPDYARS